MINGVHDHKPPVFISDEIDMQITKWSTAKSELMELIRDASKRYDELKPLIKYYEHEMLLAPSVGQA